MSVTSITTKQTGISRESMPALPDNRFFEILHNKKSRLKPVTVVLRESMTEQGRLVSMSRVLGFDYTIADPTEIRKVAEVIVARVGRIDEVVGVF